MTLPHSVAFFERQFQRQVRETGLCLNPFEEGALPWLRGEVLDFGCGLGNLSVAAARRGCHVLALDGSATAIEHLRLRARNEGLAIEAQQADLADYRLPRQFDSIAAIGLLMFLDCAHALRQLAQLQACLRPGGVLVLNLLVQGTTYLDMFDPQQHCLQTAAQWRQCFSAWRLERDETQDFPAPGGRVKAFLTLIATRPLG
jgi:tellurite methyltransferase